MKQLTFWTPERLAALLALRRMPEHDLADAVGVSRHAVWRWLQPAGAPGHCSPSRAAQKTLDRLEREAGVI